MGKIASFVNGSGKAALLSANTNPVIINFWVNDVTLKKLSQLCFNSVMLYCSL